MFENVITFSRIEFALDKVSEHAIFNEWIIWYQLMKKYIGTCESAYMWVGNSFLALNLFWMRWVNMLFGWVNNMVSVSEQIYRDRTYMCLGLTWTICVQWFDQIYEWTILSYEWKLEGPWITVEGGEQGDYIICKLIEINCEKLKIDKIQSIVNEVSLSTRLSPHLEFPNSRINHLLLRGIHILEYTYSKFQDPSWHLNLIGRVDTSTLKNPPNKHFKQHTSIPITG